MKNNWTYPLKKKHTEPFVQNVLSANSNKQSPTHMYTHIYTLLKEEDKEEKKWSIDGNWFPNWNISFPFKDISSCNLIQFLIYCKQQKVLQIELSRTLLGKLKFQICRILGYQSNSIQMWFPTEYHHVSSRRHRPATRQCAYKIQNMAAKMVACTQADRPKLPCRAESAYPMFIFHPTIWKNWY